MTRIKMCVLMSPGDVALAVAAGADALGFVTENLTGDDRGACRDIVCLNAAPLLYVSSKATTLEDGLEMARAAIDDGRAVAKQIGWDQALDEIAAKLEDIRQRDGAEAVATSSGTGRGAHDFAKTRFMNLFGSPNRFGAVTICYGPRSMVWYSMFGGAVVPSRKPGITKMMTLWGRNPHEGGPSSWHSFQEAKKAGLRTMVVDPRHTEPARQADCWVQLRPGTDAALALGLMHIIVEEGLHDRQYIEQRTYGFDDLRVRLKEYPPDKVAQITGLSVSKLVETARFFAANQPSTMVIGEAAEHSTPNSIQAIRAINVPPLPDQAPYGGLATTGKNELKSTILEQLGYDPLPSYSEPEIPPDIRRHYRFLSISGCRLRPYHHSKLRHVESFRRLHPDPIVEIHVAAVLRLVHRHSTRMVVPGATRRGAFALRAVGVEHHHR